MTKIAVMLEAFTNAQIAAVFNEAIVNHSLPAEPIKRYASKKVAVAHIEATCEEYGLALEAVNDGVALVKAEALEEDPTSGADNHEPFDEDVGSEDDGDADQTDGDVEEEQEEDNAETVVAAAPFVKLPKEELPPRGTPEREAYRKARRAAARAARKAREAA